MPVSLDQVLWEAVPDLVSQLYKEAAPAAERIRKAVKGLKSIDGYGYVFWHPERKAVWVCLSDSDDQSAHNRWKNRLQSAGFSSVQTEAESHPPDADDWIRVKTAAPLGFVGKAWEGGTKMLGGPNAMATTIAGGLLTGGLGYGAGALIEKLFPERILERGKLRKNLGMVGLGVGMIPGIWQGAANYRDSADAGAPLGVMGSMFTNSNKIPSAERRIQQFPGLTPANNNIPSLDPELAKMGSLGDIIKNAVGEMFQNQAGGMNIRSVPVDAFNRAVWNDVRAGAAQYNPYGSKDPWGTNDQPLRTPPMIGAATTGLMSGISEMAGGASLLSPATVVRGIAGAGVGMAMANLAGRTLSAMAGLSPPAQQSLQNMGAWAGLLNAVIPPLFER